MANSSEIISGYLRSEITRGSFPGAQYLIGEHGRVLAEGALGLAVAEPERISATLETIYDLASLTKPLVTSLLAVLLAERGLLDLKAPLARWLDEFAGTDKRDITLTQLLTHTSGLPNWRPLYLEAGTRAEVPATIARTPLDPRPRGFTEVTYSDLNYILMGFVLERLTGEALDRLAEREIFEPLALKRTMFNPSPELLREIAATEHGQEFEFANAISETTTSRLGNEVTGRAGEPNRPGARSHAEHGWRSNVIWGEVHDGNAHFMSGVAGHAGLFSTSREVFRIANQFLEGSALLSTSSLQLFRDNLTKGRNTARSIGWILAETPDCSAGAALAPVGIGHNGFTGTSVWMDPRDRRVFILLTNRVHPRVGAIDMREIRRRFNTLAVEMVCGF